MTGRRLSMRPPAGQRPRGQRVGGHGDDRGGSSALACHRLRVDRRSAARRPPPGCARPWRRCARRLAGPRCEGTQGPNRPASPWAWRACGPTGCTAAGAVLSCGSRSKVRGIDGWPDIASGPHLCTPPGPSARSFTARLESDRGLRPVSRLSAAIPHVALCRTTVPCAAATLSRADVVPGMATEGRMRGCGWHGMQEVRRQLGLERP